jgi:hypothetical protein
MPTRSTFKDRFRFTITCNKRQIILLEDWIAAVAVGSRHTLMVQPPAAKAMLLMV